MRLFVDVIHETLKYTKTLEKISVIRAYLEKETHENRPFAFHFLIGKNCGRFCPSALLREWCAQIVGYPLWLINETYDFLGDNSETIASVFNKKESSFKKELHTICTEMMALKKAAIEEKKEWVISNWQKMSSEEMYCFNKLLGGGIRIGATKKNVLKALSQMTTINTEVLEHRLMGNWQPTQEQFEQLISPNTDMTNSAQPYPFYLASPLDKELSEMIDSFDDWIIESKWDGIRAQLIKRGPTIALWSRGNELISDSFPEIIHKAQQIPDGVYDGELLAWDNNQPLPFNSLQKRLQRKKVSDKMLASIPCTLVLYDLLEIESNDIRTYSLEQRKKELEARNNSFPLSESLSFNSIADLETYISRARELNIEGVILKHKTSHYHVGRVRGGWWKCKIDPLRIDLVVIYAQKGRGIRSGLFTDYTFAAWDGERLVPVTKAYSGLSNKEMKEVDRILKKHLKEKFGPVRAVEPTIVMEIACEGIQESSRHKSGIAFRFPRISRLRLDKPIEEANTLDDIKKLI